MEFTSSVARDRYDAFVAVASRAIVGLDMDGTLSPIVDDPALAHIHPDIPEALTDLAEHILAVAIITGRPARQALALGGLDEVGDAVGEMGKELFVLGQYGNERWTSSSRRIVSPRPPHGLASFLTELTGVLRKADAVDAFVEEKGLAVAVHTRRLADPAAALARISGPMTELATRHGLVVEPGRNVAEVRAPGMDKGAAIRALAEELDAGAFCFAGDDLGDVEAFAAVEQLREAGLPTLLVCSESQEESVLRARADVVVHGPDGMVELLHRLATDGAAATG